MADKKLIEVNRVTSDEEKKTVIKKQTICIGEIQSYRKWHKKSPWDDNIKGEMLLLYMKKDGNEYTIKIEENYEEFGVRSGIVIPVKSAQK